MRIARDANMMLGSVTRLGYPNQLVFEATRTLTVSLNSNFSNKKQD